MRWLARGAGLLLAGVLVAGDASAAVPTTELVDVSSAETQANASVGPEVAVSSRGRYVAFWSAADNLVPGDTNGVSDVFVRDRVAGTTQRVSVATDGEQGNRASFGPVAMSGDGRYVVFQTIATNLAPGTGGESGDLVMRDRRSARTRLVESFGRLLDDHPVFAAAVSDDGRFVAYDQQLPHTMFATRKNLRTGVERIVNVLDEIESGEPLVGMSADGTKVLVGEHGRQVWIHNFRLDRSRRVDVNDAGTRANAPSTGEALSADGRYVLFTSAATNLVERDANHRRDAFVRDLRRHRTRRISISATEVEGDKAAWGVGLSGHGRYASFVSSSTNLVRGDSNGRIDLFVRDALARTTRRCSIAADGDEPHRRAFGGALARNGRWSIWTSRATDLVPPDHNGLDVFARGPGC